MSTDKELLIECLQNMGITVGILAGIEEHMIEYPHKSKSALHQLNQELQEYLETYGVAAAENAVHAHLAVLSANKRPQEQRKPTAQVGS